MNERIKELAIEAGFIVIDDKIHFDEGNNVVTSCQEAHKLIDLIFKSIQSYSEEILIMEDEDGYLDDWDLGYRNGIQRGFELLLTHFETKSE